MYLILVKIIVKLTIKKRIFVVICAILVRKYLNIHKKLRKNIEFNK